MSRQVGASIYSKDGEFLSVGWNDVPRYGGGLYREEDESKDHRCYLWRNGICHNDQRKSMLYDEIYDRLLSSELLSPDATRERVISTIAGTGVRNLMEFSRSVHAEMEAIISVARAGKGALVGAWLYSTTFPCHSCARHIVASGISKVYYIEPYTKSLAGDLHDDSISQIEFSEKKVHFLQFEGVAPKNIIKLFGHGEERKRDGKLIERDKHEINPVFRPAMDGFTTHEKMILAKLKEIETTISGT